MQLKCYSTINQPSYVSIRFFPIVIYDATFHLNIWQFESCRKLRSRHKSETLTDFSILSFFETNTK